MKRLSAVITAALVLLGAPAVAQFNGCSGGFCPGQLGGPAVPLTAPTGFGWPFATYPITVYQNGTTNFVPESYAAPALAGPSLYVNCATGNDGNPGTIGSKVKSIHRATTLGNALAVPYNVQVDAGNCPRENGFSNSSTPVPNTQPAAYIAVGGVVETWAGSTLTWGGAPDPTYPTMYRATRSNVSQVINPTILDAYGDPIIATKYATPALANAASGSAWAQDVGDVVVKWAGGAAVTNANTRVLLKATPQLVTDATSKNIYIRGFSLQGGAAGTIAMTAAATMNFIAVDTKAGYAGDDATNVNAWKIDFISGLFACVRCVAHNAQADGFNTHWTPGGVPALYTLTINSVGRNNGRDLVQSCNGLTNHDDTISIDVGGEYFGNYGANVIPINAGQMWGVFTYAHDSLGDVSHGGATTPTDYQTQFTAQLWLQNARSAVSATSVIASNTSVIRLRNFTQGPGQAQGAGGGTITSY